MIDADRLVNLILTSDFTYSELEGVAVQYLGLMPSDARDIMSATGMGRKVSDLVAWAYQHELSNELSAGILGSGHSKRAIREWIVNSVDMANEPSTNQNYASLERRFERMETNINDRLTYVERELQRLSVATLARATSSPLNWTIVIIAFIIAIVAGLAVFMTGRLT